MGLYPRYQIVPCLYLRYLYRYNHVNIYGLVEQNLHSLPGPERLRCHPVPCRKVVVRRLYHLLLPPGTHTHPSSRAMSHENSAGIRGAQGQEDHCQS